MQNSDRFRDEARRAADPLAPGFGLDPMPMDQVNRPYDEARLDAVEARQGGTGRPILYVLIAALILGGFYLMGTTFWAANEGQPPPGQIASTEQTRISPAPTPAPTPDTNVTPPAGQTGTGQGGTTTPPAR